MKLFEVFEVKAALQNMGRDIGRYFDRQDLKRLQEKKITVENGFEVNIPVGLPTGIGAGSYVTRFKTPEEQQARLDAINSKIEELTARLG